MTTDLVRQFAEDVAPLFHHHRWTWTGYGVPSIDDVEKFVQALLDEVKEGGVIGSGRIVATVEPTGERRLEVKHNKLAIFSASDLAAPTEGETDG